MRNWGAQCVNDTHSRESNSRGRTLMQTAWLRTPSTLLFFIIGGGEVYVKVRGQLCGNFSPSAFSGVLGIKPRLLAFLSSRFYLAHWPRLFLLLIFIFWDSVSLNNFDCPNFTVSLPPPASGYWVYRCVPPCLAFYLDFKFHLDGILIYSGAHINKTYGKCCPLFIEMHEKLPVVLVYFYLLTVVFFFGEKKTLLRRCSVQKVSSWSVCLLSLNLWRPALHHTQ